MHQFARGFTLSSILGKSYRSFCESLPSLKRSCRVYFGRSGTICVCVFVGMCVCVSLSLPLCLLGCSMSIWQRLHLIINNRFVREKRSSPLRHVVTLKTAVPSQFELHCFNWWLACSCCVRSLSGSHLLRDFSAAITSQTAAEMFKQRDGENAHCGTFKGHLFVRIWRNLKPGKCLYNNAYFSFV